jgi:hypothetical protein
MLIVWHIQDRARATAIGNYRATWETTRLNERVRPLYHAALDRALSACGDGHSPPESQLPAALPPSPQARSPDTHSVGSICDHDFHVFTVTNIATENTDAVPPAHPVPRKPKPANQGLQRCRGLAFVESMMRRFVPRPRR